MCVLFLFSSLSIFAPLFFRESVQLMFTEFFGFALVSSDEWRYCECVYWGQKSFQHTQSANCCCSMICAVLCHTLFFYNILNNLKFSSVFKYNRIRYACYTCKASFSHSHSLSLTHSFIHPIAHSTAPNRPTLFSFISFLYFHHFAFLSSHIQMIYYIYVCCRVNYNGHLKPVEFCYNTLNFFFCFSPHSLSHSFPFI